MPNLHKLSLIVLASLSILCLNASAQQVYESTDEQGNVTFSDTPSPGSRAVTIQAPNLGDAVKVPPPSPDTATEQAPRPQPPAASGEVPADLSTINNDTNDDDGGYYDYRRPRYDGYRRHIYPVRPHPRHR